MSACAKSRGDDVMAQPRRARRIGIGIAAVGLLLGLTGCAAGQHAPTAEETPVVDGVSANVGQIALRAVTVAAPADASFAKGADATLQLVMINNGAADDQLGRVTSPAAAQVRLFSKGAAAGVAATPSGTTSETSAPVAPVTADSINLPTGRAITVGYTPDEPAIQLHNLSADLFPGQTVQVTFQFAKAGSVTFTITVHLTAGPSSTPTLDISPTAEG